MAASGVASNRRWRVMSGQRTAWQPDGGEKNRSAYEKQANNRGGETNGARRKNSQ